MTIHCSTMCCTKGLERAQMCTLGTSGINCGGYYTALRRNSVIFAMLESFSEYHLKWETKVKNTLHSTCSKCGLQSRSGCIIITRKLVRNEKTFGCSPKPTESETLGTGPYNLCFNQPLSDERASLVAQW